MWQSAHLDAQIATFTTLATAIGTGSARDGYGSARDGVGDRIPQRVPGLQRELDGLRTLGPLAVVVAAQVNQHLHRHRGVLFTVDLDVPRQVVLERRQRAGAIVGLDD